jgi:cytochrome c-type biogenesis protein CcmE
MHPQRKQRLQLVLLILTATTVVVGLVLYLLRENGNYFYTPTQIVSGEAPQDVFLRAGGMVVDGSVVRADDSLWVQFKLTDGIDELTVEYTGIVPDLFTEGQAAIASGTVDQQQVLQATQILAKHDENYTPPEVADAMNQAHERKKADKARQAAEADAK